MWRVQHSTSLTREAKVQQFSRTLVVEKLDPFKVSCSLRRDSSPWMTRRFLVIPAGAQRDGLCWLALGILLTDAGNLTFHWDVKAPRMAPPPSWLAQSPPACWADVLSLLTLHGHETSGWREVVAHVFSATVRFVCCCFLNYNNSPYVKWCSLSFYLHAIQQK